MLSGLRKRLLAAAALLVAPGIAQGQAAPPAAPATAPPCSVKTPLSADADLRAWYGPSSESAISNIGGVVDMARQPRIAISYKVPGDPEMIVTIERAFAGNAAGGFDVAPGYRVTIFGGLASIYRVEAAGKTIEAAYGHTINLLDANPTTDSQAIGLALLTGQPVSFARQTGETYQAPQVFQLQPARLSGDQQRSMEGLKFVMANYQAAKCQPTSANACFLTTATVQALGLEDDCWELTLLRRFRDDVLARSAAGRSLVSAYYDRAPRIVERISARPDSARIWLTTYFTGILPSAIAARLGLNHAALAIYRRMTERLERLAS